MFNINFLGPPGIQPDIINSYISYRPDDKKNIKNIIIKKKPSFFTKIIDFIPTKADYLSFIILCFIIIFFIYFKPDYNHLSNKLKQEVHSTLTLDTMDLKEKYLLLTEFIVDIRDNEQIKLIKIATRNSSINFKFTSDKIQNLNSFRKKLRKKYNLNSRINGDSTSKFIITTEIPWKVYDNTKDLSKVQNFGKSSFILFVIEDLIKDQKLHKGNIRVDLTQDDNYFIKFYPASIDI